MANHHFPITNATRILATTIRGPLNQLLLGTSSLSSQCRRPLPCWLKIGRTPGFPQGEPAIITQPHDQLWDRPTGHRRHLLDRNISLKSPRLCTPRFLSQETLSGVRAPIKHSCDETVGPIQDSDLRQASRPGLLRTSALPARGTRANPGDTTAPCDPRDLEKSLV